MGVSEHVLAQLQRADALEPDAPVLTPAELRQLESRQEVEGDYILRLVAAAVAGLPERISLTATARTVELDCQGGLSLLPELLTQPPEQLLQAPLRRPLRHLALATQMALQQGAAEVEIASGTQRAFLTPRGSSVDTGTRPEGGWLVRVSWPQRTRCPEPHHVYDRFALSPVPIKVNGSLVNPPLDVGACAVALELAGATQLNVDSEPLVMATARVEEFWGWLGLGGDWSWQERPRSRVYCVVDGLCHPLDELDLGASDVRAVLHIPGLATTWDGEDLDRHHLSLQRVLTQLARQVDRCKLELARGYTASETRPLAAPEQELLHVILGELRARGQVPEALELAHRLGDCPEVGASLAARLGRSAEARQWLASVPAQPDSREAASMVWLEVGDAEKAEHSLREAERLRRQSRPGRPDPVRFSATLGRLSAVCLAQGRYAEADRFATEGTSLAAEALEEDHPAIPRALLGRVRAYLAQDRLVEAARMAAQAAELFPKEPLELAHARVHQALVGYLANDLEAADDFAGEAAARFRLRWGASHPEMAAVLLLRGLLHERLGQAGKAGIFLTQSLAALTDSLGETHPDGAAVNLALAGVRFQQGARPLALEHARAARSLYSQVWGSGHPAVARALDRCSRIHLALGDLQPAEEEAREAVRILGYTLRQPELVGTFPDRLGTANYRWWDEGDGMEVHPPLPIPAVRLGREGDLLVRALLQLARVLLRTGKEGEARTCLARAREVRGTRGTAVLALAPEGPMRRSPHGFTVLVHLQAPGRVPSAFYLDTAPRSIRLTSEGKVRVEEGVMVLKEPERRLIQPDSPLLSEPWGPQPVSFLLHAAEPASNGIRGKPRVVTVAFREGPCLRLPVRL